MNMLTHKESLERLEPGKDLIAMDQSKGTHVKHARDQFGLNIDPDAFDTVAGKVRAMIRTTPKHGLNFSGRIEHIDEIMTPDGKPIEAGLDHSESTVICKLLGLNKETGLIPDADLQAFPEQIAALSRIGVHVVKLRSTFYPGMPQEDTVRGIEQFVALQKALAKQGDVSAIHEPEFLHTAEGNVHDLKTNRLLMTMVLGGIVQSFRREGVMDHPWLLKTSVAAPGRNSGESIEPEACAEATLQSFEGADLPEAMRKYLLSGGHEDGNIRMILQGIHEARTAMSDSVDTSFSRTLLKQVYQEALYPHGTGQLITADSTVHVGRGQTELHRQGKLNRLAKEGRYEPQFEDRNNWSLSDLPK